MALENCSDSNVLLNLGFAALWIGEILEAKNDYGSAYVAFRRAFSKWKLVSPPRARTAMEGADRVREMIPLSIAVPISDWECDKAFLDWLYK
jgi:hypothetical protein